jgi:hypothetical protein
VEAVLEVPKRLDYLAARVEEVGMQIFFQALAQQVKDLLVAEAK